MLESIIIKINHMFILWVSTVLETKRLKLENSISTAKKSFEFLGFLSNGTTDPRE